MTWKFGDGKQLMNAIHQIRHCAVLQREFVRERALFKCLVFKGKRKARYKTNRKRAVSDLAEAVRLNDVVCAHLDKLVSSDNERVRFVNQAERKGAS